MLYRATQDKWVTVESSDKMWSTEGGNGKPLQYTSHENAMNYIKRQKSYDTKRWAPPPRLESVQYATGEEQRTIINSSRKNVVAGPKQKWHSVMDVYGDESKIRCSNEQ